MTGAQDMDDAQLLGGDPDKGLPDGQAGPSLHVAKGRESVGAVREPPLHLPLELGVSLGHVLSQFISIAWVGWVDAILAGLRHDPGLLGMLTRTDVALLKKVGHVPASAEIRLRPGLLNGPKAERHASAGDALTIEQWKKLPQHLTQGDRQLFLDTHSNNVLGIMPGGHGDVQLVLHVNFQEHKPKRVGNMAVSAYRTTARNIRQRVARGELVELKSE